MTTAFATQGAAAADDRDDLDAYVARLTKVERDEIAAAEAAIELAQLLYQARQHRGLSQAAAAERAGLRQQAVSRLERPGANVQMTTLRKYLDALGYAVEINVIDVATGVSAAKSHLAIGQPAAAQRR